MDTIDWMAAASLTAITLSGLAVWFYASAYEAMKRERTRYRYERDRYLAERNQLALRLDYQRHRLSEAGRKGAAVTNQKRWAKDQADV